MKLVLNKKNQIVGHGSSVERVNAQGEKNLIKVSNNDSFFYIGTIDRDDYVFEEINDSDFPEDFISGKYLYINKEFVIDEEYVEPEDSEEN
jgi:hypothetical protein